MEITRQQNVTSFVVVPLINAASRPNYKAAPTLAAGDVKIVRHTGGTWNVANIGTLPSAIAGATTQVLVTLTATELNPDDNKYPIIIQFIDQTGTKEWDDQEIIVWTRPVVADMRQINGSDTDGNNAVLSLKQLNIINTSGPAIIGTAGSSGPGAQFTGVGASAGLSCIGGATGAGISATGGGTGHGISAISAGSGSGLWAAGGTNGNGIVAIADGSGAGIRAAGGANSHGINATGGSTAGNGIYSAALASGLSGIKALGSIAGHGAEFVGGTTGHGIKSLGGSTSGHGIVAEAATSGFGIDSIGKGTGHGARMYGGATGGFGLLVQGQVTSGLKAQAGTNATGAEFTGNGSGHGLDSIGGATGNGIKISGGVTSGDAILAEAFGATGDGIHAKSASVNGMNLESGTSGNGLKVSASGAYDGIYTTGGTNKAGIHATGYPGGGANGGPGIKATATGNNHSGIQAIGDALGAGIRAEGGSSGDGIYALGGFTLGNGIKAASNNAKGILAQSSNDDGVSVVGGVAGYGLRITSGASGAYALYITGGSSAAMACVPSGSGHGLQLAAGAGNGFRATSAGDGAFVGGSVNGLVLSGSSTKDISAKEIDNIKIDTAAILVDTGTTLPAQLTSEINDVQSDIAALNDISAADVDSTLTAAHGSGSWQTGTGATPAAIADAVWDEALSGHVAAGTAGKAVADIESDVTGILADTGATLPAQITSEINDVQADIAALNDLSSADVVSACDSAITANTDIDNIDTGVNNIETKLPTNFIMGSTVQTAKDDEIDAIKAKTDNLPSDPASETNVDAVETKVDAILVDTGTTLPAQIVSEINDVQSDIAGLNDITAADVDSVLTSSHGAGAWTTGTVTAAAIADAVWDELVAGHGIVGSFSALLQAVDTVVTANNTLLSDGSDGLVAISAGVQAVVAKLPSGDLSDFQLIDTVDGITIQTILEFIMAMANGRYLIDYPSSGNITFYKRDNSTVLFTVNRTTTERTRL